MKKLTYLCLLFLLLVSCKNEEVYPSETKLNNQFKVVKDKPVLIVTGVTESGNPVPLTLTLNEISDSRCPSDVTCIWYGKARVDLTLNNAGSEAGISLCLGECGGVFRESDESVISMAGTNYKVKLLKVEPYPNTKNPKPDKYAVLEVIKLP